MTKIGLGLPGESIADVRGAAAAAAQYKFDSFSVYGDLGDLPPYAVLHASADQLGGSVIDHVGPMGVPVGLQHAEVIAGHAMALDEQLPHRTSIGLVRGAFLEQIAEAPASLGHLSDTVRYIRRRFETEGRSTPPIYIGALGPKLLRIAGELGVRGVKLGGSVNPALAEYVRGAIRNPEVEVVLGAVSVIDPDRKAARARARVEVAKYLAVVGRHDPTLSPDEQASLGRFKARFETGETLGAARSISDALLDKFALAGTPDDALSALERMNMAGVDRFEFGTPHGLGGRADAINYIGETIVRS